MHTTDHDAATLHMFAVIALQGLAGRYRAMAAEAMADGAPMGADVWHEAADMAEAAAEESRVRAHQLSADLVGAR